MQNKRDAKTNHVTVAHMLQVNISNLCASHYIKKTIELQYIFELVLTRLTQSNDSVLWTG